jgi:hypothetical protein
MHRFDLVFLLAAVTLATCGLAVIGLCWRRRAVLAGLPAFSATALAALAILRELTRRPAAVIALAALVALLIAAALLAIGDALWRLLETPSDPE